ncbi:cytosolic adenylate kinase [Paraphysoderma sedebokerense]|nr:cytosolic adenylate kinase [Paraphysoderma sedebokerense]
MSPLPDILSSTETAPHSTFDLGDRVLIFVLGGPGSGKGTQCARISQEFNLTHLSVGDLLRAEAATGSELAKELDVYLKEGKIVPMETTLKLLRKAIVSSSVSAGFLIDGFPRQMDQALEFEKEMVPPQLVLYFDCPLETLEARLLKRGETSGRSDDNLDAIRKRFKTFMEQSLPVVEYYEKTGKVAKISSIPAVEEVYQTVCSTLKQTFKI